jgi:hypothetical protein
MVYDTIFISQHFFFFSSGRKRKLTEKSEEHMEFLEKLHQLKATLPKSNSFSKQRVVQL